MPGTQTPHRTARPHAWPRCCWLEGAASPPSAPMLAQPATSGRSGRRRGGGGAGAAAAAAGRAQHLFAVATRCTLFAPPSSIPLSFPAAAATAPRSAPIRAPGAAESIAGTMRSAHSIGGRQVGAPRRAAPRDGAAAAAAAVPPPPPAHARRPGAAHTRRPLTHGLSPVPRALLAPPRRARPHAPPRAARRAAARASTSPLPPRAAAAAAAFESMSWTCPRSDRRAASRSGTSVRRRGAAFFVGASGRAWAVGAEQCKVMRRCSGARRSLHFQRGRQRCNHISQTPRVQVQQDRAAEGGVDVAAGGAALPRAWAGGGEQVGALRGGAPGRGRRSWGACRSTYSCSWRGLHNLTPSAPPQPAPAPAAEPFLTPLPPARTPQVRPPRRPDVHAGGHAHARPRVVAAAGRGGGGGGGARRDAGGYSVGL
jgi:hypothetical protein